VVVWAKSRCAHNTWQDFDAHASPEGRIELAREFHTRSEDARRLLAALALSSLDHEVRSVIDMKEGRGEPENRRTDDSVWALLDRFQQVALERGFGGSFSSRFYQSQGELIDETGEVHAIVATVLERL
jgi:hypothetical protein